MANDTWLPTNQTITPLAAAHSTEQLLIAGTDNTQRSLGQAVRAQLSPDGKTLLVLTSGFNRFFGSDGILDIARSTEAVLIYTINDGQAQLTQTIDLPNTFVGLTFSPDGRFFYVSGGKDDLIYDYRHDETGWVPNGAPITLNNGPSHSLDAALPITRVGALAAGLAIDAVGQHLLVANYQHDSVSLIRLDTRQVIQQLDLRPGKNDPTRSGIPGGEFPLDITIAGNERAFVGSVRDREIVVLNLKPQLSVNTRIALPGQPTRLLLDGQQKHLFVAVDNADQVIVLANGRIAAQGTPQDVQHSSDPLVSQFVSASPDGPVRFHYPAPDWADDLGFSHAAMAPGVGASNGQGAL